MCVSWGIRMLVCTNLKRKSSVPPAHSLPNSLETVSLDLELDWPPEILSHIAASPPCPRSAGLEVHSGYGFLVF